MPRPSSDRKQEIVEVALDVTDQLGVGALSTTAIAARIGITQPAIFRHFPRKSDLWEGIGQHLVEQMQERWDAALAIDAPARDRAAALARAQLSFIALRPAVLDIVFSRQLHNENATLRLLFQRVLLRLSGHFETLFRQMRPDDSAEAQRDAALIALSILPATALRWSMAGKGFDLVAEGMRLFERHLQNEVQA